MELKIDKNAPLKESDQISVKAGIVKFKGLLNYLLKSWKTIFSIAIICAGLGVLYAIIRNVKYTAELTFVLQEERSSGGLGQYSALASMAGIDVSNGTGLFQSDNIIELYKSRSMLEKTLLTVADFNGKDELLIDRYIHMNGLRDRWKDNSTLHTLDFALSPERFTIAHDSIMLMITSDINKNYLTVDKPDKKLSIISVRTKSIDPLFSKMFTLAIVENVNNFYIQTKTQKGLQNVLIFQKQLDSIKRALSSSITGSAAAADAVASANPARQLLRAPTQRRQVDVQANASIYSEVVKNLEISKGALQRETPLIQLIDQPKLPLPSDKLSSIKASFVGGLLGLFIAVMCLITNKIYKNIMY